MIIFDDLKSDTLPSTWYKLLDEVQRTYPMLKFDIYDNKFKRNVCIDIGANIGAFSFFASHFYKKVISFEPGYYTCQAARLKINHMENIKNVTIHNLAVSDKSGKIVKLMPTITENHKNESGNATLVNLNETNQPKNVYDTVMTIGLEDVFKIAETDFIDYLKLDCEGSEYDILLKKDLSKIGIIVAELHRLPGLDFKDLKNKLLKHLSNNFICSIADDHYLFAVNKMFDINIKEAIPQCHYHRVDENET